MSNSAKHIPTTEGSAKAWANLNGTGTIALRDSFNISSVTDNGTGDYTFSFSTAMSAADFEMSCAISQSSTTTEVTRINSYAAANMRFEVVNSAAAHIDTADMTVSAHGVLA